MLPRIKDGEVLGSHWKVIKMLGSGMIGYTYLVTSIADESGQYLVAKVAIKETLDPKAIESVRNEAERLKSLYINRIPKFWDLEETDAELILVQTFLPGRPLRERIGLTTLWNEEKARAFLKELLDILGQIHEAGIIHRDIKPENILWFEDRAYLVDFNAATLMQIAESSNTTTIGTCEYMAPEYQMRGQSSRASDIYSVGCIIAEALTGMSPTDLYSLAESRLVWRSFLPEGHTVSDAFAEIIDQMVSPNPSTRFSTVAEVQAALEDPEYKRTELAIDTLLGVYQGEIQNFAQALVTATPGHQKQYRLDEKVTSVNCHNRATSSLCWTFDGSGVITGSDDGTLAIVTPGGKVQHIRQNRNNISPVLSLAYGHDTFISTHADGTVRQWIVGNNSYELQKVVRLENVEGPHLASFLGLYSENKVLLAGDGLRPIVVELDHDPESDYWPWMIGCSPHVAPIFIHQASRIIFTKAINNRLPQLEKTSKPIYEFGGQ